MARKRKVGRPSDYSATIVSTICQRISLGEGLREICRGGRMPNRITVFRWLSKHEEFRNQYAQARALQADHFAEEILEIADDGSKDIIVRKGRGGVEYDAIDHEHVNRSRLRVDTRKFLMSKLAPKKYGDRVEVEHGVTDGLSALLREIDGRTRGIPAGG